MFDKIKQLMEIKKQAEQLKRQLDACVVEVSEVEGIKVVISGVQNFQSIAIDDHLLQDKKHLEDSLLRSLNIAIRRSQDLATQKMKETPGFNIPGLSV